MASAAAESHLPAVSHVRWACGNTCSGRKRSPSPIRGQWLFPSNAAIEDPLMWWMSQAHQLISSAKKKQHSLLQVFVTPTLDHGEWSVPPRSFLKIRCASANQRSLRYDTRQKDGDRQRDGGSHRTNEHNEPRHHKSALLLLRLVCAPHEQYLSSFIVRSTSITHIFLHGINTTIKIVSPVVCYK